MDPRFRELSKRTYPEKMELLKELCALPKGERTPFERFKLEERLVLKHGNKSEGFGMKFGLVPSWAGLDGDCRNGEPRMDY